MCSPAPARRTSAANTPDAPSLTPSSWRADIAHGFRSLWQRPVLRRLVVALSLLNLAFAMSESTFVLFARDELHVTGRGFGLLLAVVGIGSIATSIVHWLMFDDTIFIRAIGAEWIILTPHYVRPDWMNLTRERDIDDDPRPYVAGVRQFAATHDVALADAALRYGRLWRQGLPHSALLLNAINPPSVTKSVPWSE